MSNIDEVIERIKQYAPKADFDIIKKAYDRANEWHKGQMRLSGDPYITHPTAVAMILTDLEQDAHTIAAAFLHDVLEDTGVSAETIKVEFGPQIERLVSGVSKLGQFTFASKEDRQAENFRRMFVAMAEDIRIIIIKLADRLHNMQTLEFLPVQRQFEIANETREIYAPLAHRLGMWRLKWELEDLAFYYLENDKFQQIKNLVAQKREAREKYMTDFIASVTEAINKVGINATINGRSKHFYSIYNKLVQKNVEFDDIYDLIAIRVIVDNVRDCYAVLGIVHSLWKPIPGRFRDFIAIPKSNGYQSLHTTVIGNSAKPVEIQIRTKEMHRIAEYGVAAHWRYKEGAVAGSKTFELKLAWLREMLDRQKEVSDSRDFLENVKIDLFVDEVFVYSPKGDVYDLPLDSTPIDFAYHVHTQVGHRCIGAKINGKMTSLDYKLKNGDIVEIMTSKIDNPKLAWLNMVKTSGAKTKIKQWFKKQKREESISRGREFLNEELKENNIKDLNAVPKEDIEGILKQNNASSLEDLYSLIGQGEANALRVVREIKKALKLEEEKEVLLPKAASISVRRPMDGIRVAGAENVLTRLSKCCFPLPGDDIVGIVTKGRGISVHRADCANLLTDEIGKKKIKVEWSSDSKQSYPVNIEIDAFDRVGLLKDVLTQISEAKTNISSVEVKTAKGSGALINMIVDVKSASHLKNVIDSIKKVSDVFDVHRVTSAKH